MSDEAAEDTYQQGGSSQRAILGHMECCSFVFIRVTAASTAIMPTVCVGPFRPSPVRESGAGSTPQHYFSHTRYRVHSPTWHVIQCADCSLICHPVCL